MTRNCIGQIGYELTNHLGNVNVVITDRKFVVEGGRSWQTDNYRYAYNGMEVDPETKGNGNSYTKEFRQYDPRLGRWLSLDPLMAQFPWQSPYCAFDNNPVYYTDPYGLSATNKDGDPPIKMSGDRSFKDEKADRNEIALLPECPENGQVVSFEYTNGESVTTYTYLDSNEGGRWEKGVTNNKIGSGWGEGQYITLDQVTGIKNEIFLIAKKEQEEKDLNNEGISLDTEKDQAGNEAVVTEEEEKEPEKPKFDSKAKAELARMLTGASIYSFKSDGSGIRPKVNQGSAGKALLNVGCYQAFDLAKFVAGFEFKEVTIQVCLGKVNPSMMSPRDFNGASRSAALARAVKQQLIKAGIPASKIKVEHYESGSKEMLFNMIVK